MDTMFLTLTLRNCATSSVEQSALPITLNASPSFPSRRRTESMLKHPEPTVTTWAARPVPECGNLDITLDTTMIGEGNRGVTYSAQINSGTDSAGQDFLAGWPSDAPRTLCVKVAKPQHCRALAREAWFYEQLHDLQGRATAICYGFYTVALSDIEQKTGGPISIRPWEESDEYPHIVQSEDIDGVVPDELPDDIRSLHFTDEHGFQKNSPWNKWRPSADAPLLGVLVLEKLGRHYYSREEELKLDFEAQRRAMRSVVHDLTAAGVVHNDLTAFNFLRGRNHHVKRCPRHNVVHRWRVIDFDTAYMFDPLHCTDIDFPNARHQVNAIGKDVFWRILRD